MTTTPRGNRVGVAGSWARTALPDPLGTALYDAANELTQRDAMLPTYDADGNLTSDGVNSYVWNARNQLASLNGAGGPASFQYDSFGRRTRKVVNGTATEFLYDRLNPVEELSQGVLQVNLLNGLRVDEHFARTDSAATSSFLTDGLGSTLALADAGGTVQTAYTYEPFGRATVSGSTPANAFQYTGRESDGTGLYYYRARYYSPTWGRFVSEDRGAIAPASPYRFIDRDLPQVLVGKNLYEYANDSPLVFTDPLGLYPICPPASHPQFECELLFQNIYEDRERYYFFGLSCLVVQNPFLTPIFCGGLGATAGNNVNHSYVCVQDHP